MNLQQYANHRKSQGLRGQSHVAVLKAINDGRLSSKAARKEGTRWIIDPQQADLEWGVNTEQEGRGTGRAGESEEDSLPIGRSSAALREADMPTMKGIPNRSTSRAVREAYMAKLAVVQFEKETNSRVPRAEVEKEAFELARRVRELILSVPDRVSHDLASISDAALVHVKLTTALREALEQLTNA